MVFEGDNDSFMLNEVLEVEVPEQGYDQSELDRIVLTANAENYGTLDVAELNELAAIGTVVQETEVYTATGEFAQKSGEIKVLLEIYWENKKGKFRCIRIGASKGALLTTSGEGSDKEESKKEAAFTAPKKENTEKEEAQEAQFVSADEKDSKEEVTPSQLLSQRRIDNTGTEQQKKQEALTLRASLHCPVACPFINLRMGKLRSISR